MRIEAPDRAGRERLLRYCARPPFALDRLRALDRERLIFDPAKPGPGGSGPQCLTPPELLVHLAGLVPPLRLHRHRYFGVLVRMAAHEKFPRSPRQPWVYGSNLELSRSGCLRWLASSVAGGLAAFRNGHLWRRSTTPRPIGI